MAAARRALFQAGLVGLSRPLAPAGNLSAPLLAPALELAPEPLTWPRRFVGAPIARASAPPAALWRAFSCSSVRRSSLPEEEAGAPAGGEEGLAGGEFCGDVVPIPLAQPGEGIAECELLTWHVVEGQVVEAFSPLCEVQSDKAAVEITSRYAGRIVALRHAPGAMVPVGDPLVDIQLAGRAPGSKQAKQAKAQAPRAAPPPQQPALDPPPPPPESPSAPPAISPSAITGTKSNS